MHALVFAHLLASLGSPAALPQSGGGCALMTSSEIEAATGAKPGAGNEMNMPMGNGQTMTGCMWSVASIEGQIAVSTGAAPAGVKLESLTDNAGFAALAKQHYTEQTKDYGGTARCTILTPPASLKDGLNVTAFSALAKGKALSVTFMSPKKTLGIDQMKSLLDKAVSRL